MNRIYLIRHGETDWNRDGICMGQLDIPMNEHGYRQALLTSDRLASEHIDAVYSSDLVRALETARLIAEPHGLIPIKLRELRELHCGGWQGLKEDEIKRLFPQGSTTWEEFKEGLDFQPPGGESRRELYQRVIRVFEELLKKHAGQTVAIVAHGGVVRCIINYALQRMANLNDDPFYSRGFACDNCGMTLIEAGQDGELRIIYLNDTCHLQALR